jgi:chromosomal replication initiation ATPase DnaA
MIPASQIPLHLPHKTSLAEDDFLVTPSNEEAAKQLGKAASALQILLLGPRGSGKTHLAHIWQRDHEARRLVPETLDPAELVVGSAWLWENADRASWSEKLQQNAFHLLNLARENGFRLLITASQPVREWPLQLADLRSRLLALPVAQINPPDDTLVSALLLKQFRDRQLPVTEEVLNYLIPRMPRDGAQIMAIIEKLDRAALAGKRAVTIPLAKSILD